MSLLNDALRKNRGERCTTRNLPGTQQSKPGVISSRRRQWFLSLSGIALLLAASLVWMRLYVSSPAPGSTESCSPQYSGRMPAGQEAQPQAAGRPLAVSRDATTSPVAHLMAEASASVESAGPALEAGSAAEDLKSGPAPPSSVDGRNASGTGNGGLRMLPDSDPIPDHSSPREHINPGPRPSAPPAVMDAQPAITDRLFQRACQFHRRESLDQAIALYQSVLKQDPTHAQARFNLAAAYLQSGAYVQAYPLAAKLFEEDPTNQQALLNLAIAHIGCGRDRQALALLDKGANLPDAPFFEIAFHKGVALGHLGRLGQALNWYRRAEKIRPEDPGLLFNTALAHDHLQQYGDAVDYYLRYLEHAPERNAVQINQIRRRVRILQAYGAQEKLKE